MTINIHQHLSIGEVVTIVAAELAWLSAVAWFIHRRYTRDRGR